jgi:apolipoprotein N-acyltransferase
MSEPSPYAQRFATGSIVLAGASGILSFLYFYGLPISIDTEDNLVIAAFCLGGLAGLVAIVVTLYLLIRRRKIRTRIYVALVMGLAAFGLGYFTLIEWVDSWMPQIFDFSPTG